MGKLFKSGGNVPVDLKIDDLRKICVPKNIEITIHAAKRLEQRNISINDVISCIQEGRL